jgi:3-hydroxyisobutyrate dehydrogenase-like beta-hydroxyacid dehydrogenase
MTSERWGIIGFGEAGSAFARHISSYLNKAIMVTDPLLNIAPPPAHIQRRLEQSTVEIAPDISRLVAACDIVLSLVTVSIAQDVASQAGAAWKQGLFVDFNSTSPVEKQRNATSFEEPSTYVDGAILGSIAGEGAKAPLALAGPSADRAYRLLSNVGLHPSVISAQVGGASALKMCRSIFMKGIECLFVETLLAASQFDITESVLDTIEGTFRAYSTRALTQMLVTTHAIHCGRRSHEMQQVAALLGDINMPDQMSQASREFLWASHQSGISEHFNGTVPGDLEEVIAFLATSRRD